MPPNNSHQVGFNNHEYARTLTIQDKQFESTKPSFIGLYQHVQKNYTRKNQLTRLV